MKMLSPASYPLVHYLVQFLLQSILCVEHQILGAGPSVNPKTFPNQEIHNLCTLLEERTKLQSHYTGRN